MSGGGLNDNQIIFWNLNRLIDQHKVSKLLNVKIHKKTITDLRYIKSKNILMSCGSDNKVCFFRIYFAEDIP